MITEIELENYRGFKKHKIPFRSISIIVGRNNSGKTTIIEALTLISIAVSRAPRSRFIGTPEWLDIPRRPRGISPSLRGFDFEFRNLCHQYGEPPAIIKAKFTGGKSVTIYVDSESEKSFAIFRKGNRPIATRSAATSFLEDIISVLPPIGRIQIREELRQENYVRSNLNTRLASLHFRNQLYYLGDDYDDTSIQDPDDYHQEPFLPSRYEIFVKLAESSWPHLRIDSTGKSDSTPPDLSLLVRDGPFVAEVGWVGSGLQAWLQTCWFLARCPRQSIVVLDEPDVFLHPDLQRRLFRLVEGYFTQVLIATHSTEVLAEVNPESVLIVDKDSSESKFAETIPAVQVVINNIGGAHNLQLTRLWAARKCLFFEGDDLNFLSEFQKEVFPDSLNAFSAIPHIAIKGYGNWKHAVGATIGFKNAGDQSIKTYCILDSDYRTDEEHEKVHKEAKENGLSLHIWKRKEIENYVLAPSAIARLIEERSETSIPTTEEIKIKIEELCNGMENDVIDHIANEIGSRDRKGVADAIKKARNIVEEEWATYDGKVSICPGKQIVSGLSAWSQEKYGVSFSALNIAREIGLEELNNEVIQVIAAIENLSDF